MKQPCINALHRSGGRCWFPHRTSFDNDRAPDLKLHCPSTDRIRSAEGWIEDVKPDGDQIRIRFSTADRQAFTLQISRELLEQSAVFRVLNELQGRSLKVIARERLWERAPLVIQTPHQLEIRS